MKLAWSEITRHAADIVNSYDTSVTLRQLFYRLVSDMTLPNTTNAYKGLSRHTAEARRQGWFPALIDRNRNIERAGSFTSPDDARQYIANVYRRDRTEGQDFNIYFGVEKAGMVVQLDDWFGNPFGVPIVALGGYSSQTFVDEVVADVEADGRPAILLYGGDFDPSGEDIDRDFIERCNGVFDHVIRVALTADIVTEYNLPPQPGKTTDSRAAGFIAKHGRLMQVELDALDPDDLRTLYAREFGNYFDRETFDDVIAREREERESLRPAS